VTKPKLLLATGIGWSATTPLHRTLKENNIINSGVGKEHNTLYWLYDKTSNFWNYKRSPQYKWLLENKSESRLKNLDLLFSRDTTLDNFVEYYKLLSSKDYPYVSDFSNTNANLSPQFISEISSTLKENFDVKVIMIFRDPVRRGYSHSSAQYRLMVKSHDVMSSEWNDNDPRSRFQWRLLRKRFPDSISYWKNLLQQQGDNTSKFSYVQVYQKYAEHFPTLPIVMEDLWGGDIQTLENFLECKINHLHQNCYYPEMGTKAPRYEDLEDQWMSDMQDLSEEDYSFGKKHTQWMYDEWYEEFKTRPWE
jgi:hypothetical protein